MRNQASASPHNPRRGALALTVARVLSQMLLFRRAIRACDEYGCSTTLTAALRPADAARPLSTGARIAGSTRPNGAQLNRGRVGRGSNRVRGRRRGDSRLSRARRPIGRHGIIAARDECLPRLGPSETVLTHGRASGCRLGTPMHRDGSVVISAMSTRTGRRSVR